MEEPTQFPGEMSNKRPNIEFSTENRTNLNAKQDTQESDINPAANRPMPVEEIADSYAEYADRMHRVEWLDRLTVGRYRRAQFGDVDGRVLDVACGIGTNFRYLPDGVELVGIDISPEMLANAEKRLSTLEKEGDLRVMDAQELKFADDSFDTVISALSTCTFPDPITALREMERVCKPDGRIRLLEHGLSDMGPIAWFQEWRSDAHYQTNGCRWTQEPRELVDAAGLTVKDMSTGVFGTITTFDIHPNSGANH
jgi:ubiquinone/menaquinone biosynthesis C-methylase UbiE